MVADRDGVVARAHLFLLLLGQFDVLQAAGDGTVGADIAKDDGIVVVDLFVSFGQAGKGQRGDDEREKQCNQFLHDSNLLKLVFYSN